MAHRTRHTPSHPHTRRERAHSRREHTHAARASTRTPRASTLGACTQTQTLRMHAHTASVLALAQAPNARAKLVFETMPAPKVLAESMLDLVEFMQDIEAAHQLISRARASASPQAPPPPPPPPPLPPQGGTWGWG